MFYGLVTTSYQTCTGHNYENAVFFSDVSGDVKAGNFQFIQGSLGFRDLISGKIENNGEQLKLTFGLAQIPESINLSASGQKSIPEYKWVYEFKKQTEELTVGIILYSDGKAETKSLKSIPVEVFKNKKSIASCGYPTLSKESILIVCDLQSFPDLKKLNSEYSYNVLVENFDGKNLYRDCY